MLFPALLLLIIVDVCSFCIQPVRTAGVPMLDKYSVRARHVIFIARLVAGQRGAKAIGVDDLIMAFLLEDQGDANNILSGILSGIPEFRRLKFENHPRFFDSNLAVDLLTKMQGLLSRKTPISTAIDLPFSRRAATMMRVARSFADNSLKKQVEPLHLLAAATQDRSSQIAQILRETGITQERVLSAIGQAPD